MSLVWYVAYGSNLERSRFDCYLEGGVPEGGSRDYAGCVDPSAPVDDVAVELPGRLVFAGTSTVWGGGMAVYDPEGSGRVAGRAYLLTCDQVGDVVAQEMRREPAGAFARRLAGALVDADSLQVLGPGRYETVVRLEDVDERPAFTVTCDDVDQLEPQAPTAPYLRTIAAGLRDAHGWAAPQVADYLAAAEGVDGVWSRDDLEAVARPVGSR
jgi:hypothetical protein